MDDPGGAPFIGLVAPGAISVYVHCMNGVSIARYPLDSLAPECPDLMFILRNLLLFMRVECVDLAVLSAFLEDKHSIWLATKLAANRVCVGL